MNRKRAIAYFERRKIELKAYMYNVKCCKDKIAIFDKYIKMCEMVNLLKDEKE